MRLRSRFGVLLVVSIGLAFGAILPASAASLDLAAYHGKVVLLDFWASWCNPCRQSFPWMNQLQQTYGSQGLVIIGVNVDHERDAARNFLSRYGADFQIVYDPDGHLAGEYNFHDMPTSYLIGRDGRIHYVHAGFYPEKEGNYLSDILTLLDEKAAQ
jgi:cytochrome c biogenesis protein CcmG/thiol:disulfide interchange protein DsbE